jgi:hypothetical protein
MSDYINYTVPRINAAADSGNAGPVSWADDALANCVAILLRKIEALEKRIEVLEAPRRLVAIGDKTGVTATSLEWDAELAETQDSDFIAREIASHPHVYGDVQPCVAQAVARQSVRTCYKCGADLENTPAYQNGSGWYCTSH